ncbi:MAG: hypothetical protein IJH79_05745, partial [Lentisphaeria bacterium]|nr:hypothetical protein [Lentisphaeria bacterium]
MRLPLLLWMLLFPFLLTAENVVFVGSASDSELFANAFKRLKLPEKIRFRYYCTQVDADPEIGRAVREADILIVNARGRDVRRITEANFDAERTRLYALSSRLLKKGIPAKGPQELKAYRANSR